jgi:ATP synthase protein I
MDSGEPHSEKSFSGRIGEKEDLKLKARNNKRSVWSGFAVFGMIGWSVAVPTLLGTAAGMWLDSKHPQHFSWTLTCLLAGLFAGCLMAWSWISKENKDIHKRNDD